VTRLTFTSSNSENDTLHLTSITGAGLPSAVPGLKRFAARDGWAAAFRIATVAFHLVTPDEAEFRRGPLRSHGFGPGSRWCADSNSPVHTRVAGVG
jgi:hypothetical protein